MPLQDLYDLTIIGGGPTGLYAAYYAGFRHLSVKIIENLPDLGGQVTTLYPDKYIYDVAGFPKIVGKELVDRLLAQMQPYHPHVCLEEQAVELRPEPDHGLILRTNRGEHRSRTVLITAGVGVFSPRKLPNPGLERFEGKGLAYYVTQPHLYRDKSVLIVGGGDSAVDWANHLSAIAQRVTLIHRRDQFRAHEASVAQLKESKVDVRLFCELKTVHGGDTVEEAVLLNTQTRQEETIPVDAVLAYLGFVVDLGPIKRWGLALDKEGIVVNSRMETNLPGVYSAGDIASYPGKVKLIATGFGEAATAVCNAATYIHPEMSLFPGHSSTVMEKEEEKKPKGGTAHA